MQEQYLKFLGYVFPFFMNAMGALFVFFIPRSKREGCLVSGFSGGVMAGACIWSLIVPAVRLNASLGYLAFLPALIGLSVGLLLSCFSDMILKKHTNQNGCSKLFWAITLHNIPEGLSVGFALGASGLGLINALTISFGIGVQNLPEGFAVALSYKDSGKNNRQSFCYGVISGAVEPFSALIGSLLVSFITFLQPYILTFSAGAMIYVIAEELIPKSVQSKKGVLCFIFGFCLMTALDLLF